MRAAIAGHRLNTVCDEAKCPNRVDCFSRGTATFMILGNRCTRDCRFCAVEHGRPLPVDREEPGRVAAAARSLGLGFVVVTSVTRDDLPDGGADLFADTIRAVRRELPEAGVEVLVPDFGGSAAAVDAVLAARPDVFAHNVETVPRLYPSVRSGADYERSLGVLARAAGEGRAAAVKSALMLGLGEERAEVERTLRELRSAGVDIVYLGQYLRPSEQHRPVARFVPPDEFEELRRFCIDEGFHWVSAGPFVRSSYQAELAAAGVGARQRGSAMRGNGEGRT